MRGEWWKFWFLSGRKGEYVDIDFSFFHINGYLHIRYSDMNVCKNPDHS